MKIQFKQTFIFFLFLLLLQSCKPDDIYYDLSVEAKAFLIFDVGDTFKLKNHQTNEIITFSVTSKKIQHYEYSLGSSSMVAFGTSGGDTYLERGEYVFKDENNCYNGNVSVEATDDNKFKFTIYLKNCVDSENYFFEYYNEFSPNIDVLGTTYSNAYLLRFSPEILYYSKEKGILKIVNNFNKNTIFSIVE